MIYIATHHRTINFGACLQSYALQKTLDAIGYESRLVLVKGKKRTPVPKNLKEKVYHSLQKIYGKLYERDLAEGFANFDAFCKTYHRTTEEYESFDALRANPPKDGVYLSGSDQVFNPRDINPMFFLQFGGKDIRRISYAGSISAKDVPKENADIFREYLSCFDRLSIRESFSLPLVEKYCDKKAEVHVDPSFLVEKETWDAVCSTKKQGSKKRPYILVYVLYKPEWLNDWLKKLKKETGFDIVAIQFDPFRNLYSTKKVRNAGPSEFLELIRDAEMVISSSYHGCVFSTIFRKPFYAVVNPSSPARISSMLDLFHLTDRVLSKETAAEFTIDYSYFEEALPKEQERAKKYLKEAIEG